MKPIESLWPWLKLTALIVFVGGAALTMHGGGLSSEILKAEVLEPRMEAAGGWAPIVFIGIYALLITLTLPGTLVTLVGATLFPLATAFALTIVGAMTGASLSFFIGRLLGRSASQSVLEGSENPIITKIHGAIRRFEDNGILAVAYLRMVYVPFVALNYFAPLTGIRYRDFAIGTLIGILPGSFVFVFMGNSFQTAWRSGDISLLFNGQFAIAIALFAVSLILPHVLQHLVFSKEKTGQG